VTYRSAEREILYVDRSYQWRIRWGRGPQPGSPPPPKRNLKSYYFVDTMISKALRELLVSLNEPLKLAEDWFSGILEIIIKTYKFVEFLFPFTGLISPLT
jgi:hypothetical protein